MLARRKRQTLKKDDTDVAPTLSPPQPINPRDLGIVCLLVVVTLVPMLSKPVHVDDPLFVWTAKQIAEAPADFYGFDVNWYGYSLPMHEVTQNPPLWSYVLALFGIIFGFGEVSLHLATLMAAVAAAAATYLLAARLGARPLLSACLAWATPALLVSSTTLMCDTALVALWVGAVLMWVRGHDTHRPDWFYLAGLLAGLAGITKYYGVCLFPLLAAYSVAQGLMNSDRGKGQANYSSKLIAHLGGGLLVGVLVLAAFDTWTSKQYGRGLVGQALLYASSVEQPTEAGGRNPLRQLLVTLGFAGGSIPIAFVFSPLIWRSRTLGMATVAIIVFGLMFFSFDGAIFWAGAAVEEPGIVFLLQAMLMVAAGMALSALPVLDLMRRKDASSVLLALWVFGTLVFAGVLNWTTNTRSLLPAVPAVAILVGRNLPQSLADTVVSLLRIPDRSYRYVLAGLTAVCLLLSLTVATADFRLASSVRQAADDMAEQFIAPGDELWFQGHWGLQYYLQAAGGYPFEVLGINYPAGARLVLPSNNTNPFNLVPLKENPDRATRDVLAYPGPSILATISSPLGAGFYASEFGPLPYAFGSVPQEEYTVYTFPQPFAIKVGK